MVNKDKMKPVIRDLSKAIAGTGGIRRLYTEFDRQKQPLTYDDLAKTIDRLPEGTLFVLDNCFIPRHEIDRCVWDALLKKRIVISPFVWKELQDWLTTPFSNKHVTKLFREAEGKNDSPIILDHETHWPPGCQFARTYYVTLLSSRKQRSHSLVDSFKTTFGRSPTTRELDNLWQRSGKERDFQLLRKGYDDFGKDNYFADEDVVVTAAMTAFVIGRDTVILTRDGDVFDQFIKFTGLLTWHYQAMLFADLYATAPGRFTTKSMPIGIPELEAFFFPEECTLVKKHVGNLDHFTTAILPSNCCPISLTCVLFGGNPPDLSRSFARFVGEKDIGRLFNVKGQTKGLNTDKLGGMNCHVTGFPLGIENPRQWVIVGKDKSTAVQSGNFCLFNLDYAHTNFHFEVLDLWGVKIGDLI